jgi:chromosome segregation ATPase
LVRKLGLMTDCVRDANRIRHYFVLDLEGAQSHVERYNQKIVELEDKIAQKQLQMGELAERGEVLAVRYEETQAKCQPIPPDLSEKKQAAAVKRQEKLDLSLERIERQRITATADIDRLDGQIDRYQRSIDRSYRGVDKYMSLINELELRPRLFAAASARLESLTTKLLDRDISSPVGSEIEKKVLKLIPVQGELRLKLPPS